MSKTELTPEAIIGDLNAPKVKCSDCTSKGVWKGWEWCESPMNRGATYKADNNPDGRCKLYEPNLWKKIKGLFGK